MINLIPTEEKKELKKIFYLRALTVLFTMLGAALMVATVALVPSYIFSFSKADSLNTKLEEKKSEVMPEIDQKAQAEINDLNIKIGLIKNAIKDKYVFSEKVVNEVIAKKIPGIRIEKISYQVDEFKGKVVTLSGVAESREKLLIFRRSFEGSSVFKNVDLPISDFVKGSNIHFNLNLTAK